MTSRDFVMAFLVVLLLIVGYAVYAYYTKGPAVPGAIDPETIKYTLS